MVTTEQTELGSTLLTLYDVDTTMIACLEYFWVKDMVDLRRADRGQRPAGGDVLYVTNVATAVSGTTSLAALIRLKHFLPPHRYLVGLRLVAPKGVPDDFFAHSTAVPVPV